MISFIFVQRKDFPKTNTQEFQMFTSLFGSFSSNLGQVLWITLSYYLQSFSNSPPALPQPYLCWLEKMWRHNRQGGVACWEESESSASEQFPERWVCKVCPGNVARMLTEREKEGCKTILTKLTEQDLLTLTDTVTNRVVSPENFRGMNRWSCPCQTFCGKHRFRQRPFLACLLCVIKQISGCPLL